MGGSNAIPDFSSSEHELLHAKARFVLLGTLRFVLCCHDKLLCRAASL